MEAFGIGSHVVIELEDERKIAGYIVGLNEDGLLLKATHREQAVATFVPVAVSEDLRRQLNEKTTVHLRYAMVANGMLKLVRATREVMVEALLKLVVADLQAEPPRVVFRELSNPILTFVNSGFIKIMEDTDDKVAEAEVSLFDQTVDTQFYAILDEEDQKKKDAEAEALGEKTTEETNELQQD